MKILVEVKTPGNGKTYEFQIDNQTKIGAARGYIASAIIEAENGNITLKPEKICLFHMETRAELADNSVLATAGVKSGHCLLLV